MGKLWEVVRDALQAALEEYGAGYVLLALATIALFALLQRSWSNRLKDKDAEIKRMAQRNRDLENHLLKNRLSTEDNQQEKT